MSLKAFPAVLAIALCTAPAHAAPSSNSVALLGGYGTDFRANLGQGPNAYAGGLGVTAGRTFGSGLFLGGTFVEHFGWFASAQRDTGVASYRAAYRAVYGGPELGYDLALRALLLRPYVGGGMFMAFGRTSVGRYEVKDDELTPWISPGLLIALRVDRLVLGIDGRMPITSFRDTRSFAPAIFLSAGIAL